MLRHIVREKLPKYPAERKSISTRIALFADRLLRSHESERARPQQSIGAGAGSDRAGMAEITELYRSIRCKEDVFRLEVAMDHLRLMQSLKPIEGLPRDG